MKGREKNFKIARFHGKLTPREGSKEAKLRNSLYLIGNLRIPLTQNEVIRIRLIGYEIPIGIRGRRIDLIGYDTEKNPCIIELKAATSPEKISQIINQIEGYAQQLPLLLSSIENEFNTKFFLNLNLTRNIRRIILAPREYFSKQERNDYLNVKDIFVCSIGLIRKNNLMISDNLDKYETITLTVLNKCILPSIVAPTKSAEPVLNSNQA